MHRIAPIVTAVITAVLLSTTLASPSAAVSSSILLTCQKRFESKVRAFTRLAANKLHSCADRVVRCKLGSEIDMDDPTACLAAAGEKCSVLPTTIGDALAKAKTKITDKCTGIPIADFQSFVGGLGFSNLGAGCNTAMTVNDLIDCVIGVTGPTGTFGAKCAVEREAFIRDPRAVDSLSDVSINLDPANNFPCLGP